MIKSIALIVVVALTSASAEWWPDYNQLENQRNEKVEGENYVLDHTLNRQRNRQWLDQLLGRNSNRVQTSKTSTTSSATPKCTNLRWTTSPYKPVCGTDGISYYNSQQLDCVDRYRHRVSKAYTGKCIF